MQNNPDAVSDELLNLDLASVEIFDRDITDGRGREYYESSEITRATVFRNKLSGTVGTFVQGYQVDISLHGNEIAAICSCNTNRKICIHAIALLYSWIFDGDDFLNISTVLQQIETLEKSSLVLIIKNIIRQYPGLADVFLARDKAEWYEIDPEPDYPDL